MGQGRKVQKPKKSPNSEVGHIRPNPRWGNVMARVIARELDTKTDTAPDCTSQNNTTLRRRSVIFLLLETCPSIVPVDHSLLKPKGQLRTTFSLFSIPVLHFTFLSQVPKSLELQFTKILYDSELTMSWWWAGAIGAVRARAYYLPLFIPVLKLVSFSDKILVSIFAEEARRR